MNTQAHIIQHNYHNNVNLQQLFLLTEHWQSDVAFYKDEFKFLYRLIDKYYIWLTNDQHIEEVRKMVKTVLEMQHELTVISTQLSSHLISIGKRIDKPNAAAELVLREEHAILESKIGQFYRNFKVIKKEIFTITEVVIESEKLQHLLEKQ